MSDEMKLARIIGDNFVEWQGPPDALTERNSLLKRVGPQVRVRVVNEQTIADGGYISVTGRTKPHPPPENQAWTIEALLRHAEVLN